MWFASRVVYYVVVLTRGWIGVLSVGPGNACSSVHGPCGGQVGVLSCRYPVCGFTVRRYVPWCRVSWFSSHSVLDIAHYECTGHTLFIELYVCKNVVCLRGCFMDPFRVGKR